MVRMFLLVVMFLAFVAGCNKPCNKCCKPTNNLPAVKRCSNPACECPAGKCVCGTHCRCGKVWDDSHPLPAKATSAAPVVGVESATDTAETGETSEYGRSRFSGKASVGSGLRSPDGKESVQIPFPDNLMERNVGGSDGAGLCVFDSMHHAGRWQHDPLFAGMFDFMKSHPGGGYPEKVDAMVKQLAQSKGYPIPKYVQVEDSDTEILKLATKNRYMPCVTYGLSPTGRYNGQFIDHMINAVHVTDNWVAVLDNNYIGSKNYEWMPVSDFEIAHRSSTTTGTSGKPWSIILLAASPPPPPKN